MADILMNLIRAQAVIGTNINDEIQQSLQALIRKHLRQVLDTHQLPPPNRPLGFNECHRMANIASGALRHDGDVLAAELLQAVSQMSQASQRDDAEHLNDFLERALGVIGRGGENSAEKFRAYMEKVLMELSRIGWFGVDHGESATLTTASEPCVTVHVGNNTMSLLFKDILPVFWGTQLDTDCHICQQPIIDEPPIRTISHVSPNTATASDTHVRVANRHFSCLKASNILWVPVSHVWDDSIRRANESRAHDDEAASTLLNALTTLLDASVDAYGPDAEFWHDYFSVPQWERMTKEALLIRIPEIYHDAQEILVQMPDLPGSYVMVLLPHGPREYSASMALRFMPVLHALCSSQWMERMWVLLEYSLCRSACVMDKSNHIWRSPDGTGGMNRDTFTTFVNNAQSVLSGLFAHAKSFASSIADGFLTGLTDKGNDEQRDLCLGEALELIARTKCQLFRDRFLAIHMVVNKNSPPSSPVIPLYATEACQWVWQAALAKADFSPLLLQPRESYPESNPDFGMPSWLAGYTSLDHAEWDLGSQQAPVQATIGFENGVIKTELEVVGMIEQIQYLDTEASGEVAGVDWAIEFLGSLAASGADKGKLSVAQLIDGLSRIFPFDMTHTKAAEHIAGVVFTLEGYQNRDRRFIPKAERYLTEYFAAPSESYQRQYAALKLTQLLKYDTHVMAGLVAEVTRLTTSRHIARSRRERGAINGEPICAVRCQESDCQVLTVFRLDLRTDARIGDYVYRISGLSYSQTVEGGVGLVLNKEGRITGRMLYGPRGCSCQSRQIVEIY